MNPRSNTQILADLKTLKSQKDLIPIDVYVSRLNSLKREIQLLIVSENSLAFNQNEFMNEVAMILKS